MDKTQEIVDSAKTACSILHEVATMIEAILPEVEKISSTAAGHCKEILSKAKTLKGPDKQ